MTGVLLKIPVMHRSLHRLLLSCCLFCFLVSCTGQQTNNNRKGSAVSKRVGGNCEDCDIMYTGMPTAINHTDTSAGWYENGQKLLVTGTVFQQDGKTPAANILLYYWQTNTQGYYADAAGLNKKAKRHGYIRGWVKTNSKGQYTIYSVRPAPYPNDISPAHIHFLVKEPGLPNEYYIDDLVFDDDPLLIPFKKKYPLENRGGSGVVRILVKGNVQVAEHDIVLGLNIPDYPKKLNEVVSSGLPVGYDQPSFIPYHAYGPDKGSQACPVCKYGRYHGILFFVGNNPDWPAIKQWLIFLEQESVKRWQYLKAYFVYGNSDGYDSKKRQKELEKIGEELQIKQMALCFVPSLTDEETEAHLNKINPTVKNTLVIYKHRRIVDKQINLKPSADNFQLVSDLLDKTRGNYFDLKGLPHQ
jgi:protocatechuate 3,4-dioxygenase beta subunit